MIFCIVEGIALMINIENQKYDTYFLVGQK